MDAEPKTISDLIDDVNRIADRFAWLAPQSSWRRFWCWFGSIAVALGIVWVWDLDTRLAQRPRVVEQLVWCTGHQSWPPPCGEAFIVRGSHFPVATEFRIRIDPAKHRWIEVGKPYRLWIVGGTWSTPTEWAIAWEQIPEKLTVMPERIPR